MADYPMPIADLSPIYPVPGKNRYFLVFSSRQQTPTVPITLGHAFVSWGLWDYSTLVCSYQSYGFYASSGGAAVISYFLGAVPGNVQDETLNGFQSNPYTIGSLVVEVDSLLYGGTLMGAQEQLSVTEPYVLGSDDCVTFVQYIAQEAGLNLPPRGLTTSPVDYIAALKQTAMAVQQSDNVPYSQGGTASFTGPMVGGLPAGSGVYTCKTDGTRWVGKVAGDVKYGVGVYTDGMGDVWHGGWLDDDPDGPVVENRADGSIFTATYANGSVQGNATWRSADGRSTYVGGWDLGFHGQGTYTFPDGSHWTGPFVNGQANGTGTFTWPDGHTAYVQYFLNGQGRIWNPNPNAGPWNPDPGGNPPSYPITPIPIGGGGPFIPGPITPGGGGSDSIQKQSLRAPLGYAMYQKVVHVFQQLIFRRR